MFENDETVSDELQMELEQKRTGIWADAITDYQNSRQNFYLCYREFLIVPNEGYVGNAIRILVNNFLGGEHAYIQYGEINPFTGEGLSGTQGWGISGIKGNPPRDEGYFKPDKIYPLTRTTNTLQYGIGQGKRAIDATDEEIIDCIENTPSRKNYKTFEYDCRHWSAEAIEASGLEVNKKGMWRR